MTVVTGGVKSNIARTERSLAADSIYLPVQAEYERRVKHSQEVGMPTQQYARSVVRQVLRSPSRDTIWEGAMSWVVWFVSTFFPRSVMVSMPSNELCFCFLMLAGIDDDNTGLVHDAYF